MDVGNIHDWFEKENPNDESLGFRIVISLIAHN
jgi:hypothetical protein